MTAGINHGPVDLHLCDGDSSEERHIDHGKAP